MLYIYLVHDETKKKQLMKPMKKCCLCCLQTTSSPKNEFHSLCLFDATGTVHVIPLCLHKSFKCIEGIISTWEMALLWIIRTSDSTYTCMITSFWVTSWFYQTIYGATPPGQGRQSYHPLFIVSTMMRIISKILSLLINKEVVPKHLRP